MKVVICCEIMNNVINKRRSGCTPTIRIRYGSPIISACDDELDEYPINVCPWCAKIITTDGNDKDDDY